MTDFAKRAENKLSDETLSAKRNDDRDDCKGEKTEGAGGANGG